ncbi:esterase [Massarina eburnea CBS 473.64]|uniref:Esterase n=1 Tax=Massarina eburnea CBS 473.64 TaxID=1395130 RepID=A0A6A6SER0_9PLEO|nr:esterase [Massarina eburnea CBS 473.64]
MTTLKFVRSVWESFRATSGLEPRLLDNLRVTAATPGRVSFELDIHKHHTNRLQILHGGTLATLTDLSGSLAVASRGLYSTGVSTDINVTYLSSGGKAGDLLKGEVVCDKFGKTMAFTSVRFMNAGGGLVARGSHSKFIAKAWEDERNRVEEMRKLEMEGKE